MTHKVFIAGKVPRVAYDMLSAVAEVTMNDSLELLTKEELIAGAAGCDALLPLLSDTIDADIINASPNLKIIANYGAGFNNIDLAAATARKIPVTNTPAVSTDATADLTWGLIIAIARRIVEGDKNTRAGRFTGWAPLYHLGVEVSNKTLGIVGMGNIGKAIASGPKPSTCPPSTTAAPNSLPGRRRNSALNTSRWPKSSPPPIFSPFISATTLRCGT
jgi:lactate dehydrogenase-like 2-hydroxyacid dehydrogenase